LIEEGVWHLDHVTFGAINPFTGSLLADVAIVFFNILEANIGFIAV